MLINNLDNPKISVIVPVFNQENFLRICLDSLLTQSYTNLQIILVNDGSTDSSQAICEEYAQKDERVVCISQENCGQGMAYKAGFSKADGEYITFVDGDDAVSPEMIITLVRGLQYNTKISACSFNTFTKDEQLKALNNMDFAVNYQTMLNDSFFDVAMSNKIIGKLFEKSLFENIDFPVINFHAEEMITYKLIYASTKVNYIAKPLYNIRKKTNPNSEVLTVQKFQDLLNAYSQKIEFFEKKGNMNQIEKTLNNIFDVYIKYYFSPLKATKQLTSKDFKKTKEDISALCDKLGPNKSKKAWAMFKMKVFKYGFLES